MINMIKKKKQMFIIIGVFALVLFLGSTSYAWFNYSRTTSDNELIAGDIYLHLNEGQGEIELSNIFPETVEEARSRNDNFITFTVDGLNTSNKTIYYEFILDHGEDKANPKTRYNDTDLRFDLIALDSNGDEIDYLISGGSFDTLINKRIWVDTVDANTTTEIVRRYKLRMWLDENVIISDTDPKATYDTTEYKNKYATIKLTVAGDFNEKHIDYLYNIMKKSAVMDNVSSEFVSASTGIDFGAISSDTNGKGVYMRAGTENNAYPIMYYRGAVEDNNVIFNNKCWKAVRTTDTGGVKLIYNGETGNVYENGDNLELSGYASVNRVTDVTDVPVPFTFESSDSTWNIELNGASNTEFEFTVPNGENYNLVMTGTSGGSSCGGTMTFYKDGSTVNSETQGGGNAMNLIYSYGSLTSSNKIKMTFSGSSSATCPITFKIKMEQNSQALSNNQYTIIANGINVSKKWTFDENEKKWYTIVPNGSSTKISFEVASNGNYGIKYTGGSGGPISIKKGNNVLTTSSGTDRVIILGTVSTSDEYSVEYQQMGSGSGRIEFALIERNDLGIGCDNTGFDTHIDVNGSKSKQFAGNGLANSLAYVGYMWGTVYPYSTSNWKSNAKFGSGFTWDGENYKLTDATETTPNDTHHYSCNSTDVDATCTSIRYVYWVTGSTKYYITISDGKGIEEAIKDMQTNTTPSYAKTQIDAWYLSNMNTVTNKLEDTVWCNDRSIGKYNGWSATGTINGSSSDYKNYSLLFGAHERSNYASDDSIVKNQPSLACANKNDAFTVSNGKGNQKLTYPVALLTEDEMVLAGGLKSSSTFYLNNENEAYWSLSPSDFHGNYARGFGVFHDSISNPDVANSIGLRPAVSLKPGTPIVSGTGTVADPYVVE